MHLVTEEVGGYPMGRNFVDDCIVCRKLTLIR